MNGFIGSIAFSVLSVFLCGGVIQAQGNVLSVQPSTSPAASDEPMTIIAGSLDVPLAFNRTTIWCASLPIAWAALEREAGGAIALEKESPLSRSLLSSRFLVEWANPADVVAEAGRTKDVVSRAKADLQKKFGSTFDARLLNELAALPPDGLAMYAYMQKELAFATEFKPSRDHTFTPNQFPGDHSTPVVGFGTKKKEGKQEEIDVRRQAQVIIPWWGYVSGGDRSPTIEYVVELKTRNPAEHLLLARMLRRDTLRDAVATTVDRFRSPNTLDVTEDEMKARVEKAVAVMEKRPPGESELDPMMELLQVASSARRLLEGESIFVPNIAFDQTAEFPELAHSRIRDGKMKGISFDFVEQRIKFALGPKGVTLKSEAGSGLFGGLSRSLDFDQPFLVMLIRDDAPLPYFAAWIGNAGVLEKRPEEVESGATSQPAPAGAP